MNRKFLVAVGLAAGIIGTGSAHAEGGIAASVGSTGFGLHVSVPVQPKLNVRLGTNYLNYSHDDSSGDLDYDAKLKLQTFDALLDYFPTDSAFRVTAGVAHNGSKVDVKAKPSAASYTLNGTVYNAASAGAIDGRIDFRKMAPYLGIGWGNTAKDQGWGFSADLGVLFQGSPRTSLTNTGCTAGALICNQLANDVAAENLSLADDVSGLKAYPVLRVGMHYKF
jgi:hypothetical protein